MVLKNSYFIGNYTQLNTNGVGSRWIRVLMILLALLLILFVGLAMMVVLMPTFAGSVSYAVLGRSIFVNKAFTKGPIVQLIGDDQAVVIWESLTDTKATFKWSNNTSKAESVALYREGSKLSSFLFREFIKTKPGQVTYSIHPIKSQSKNFNITIPSNSKNEAVAIGSKMVVIGDNQYGHSTFTKILQRVGREHPDAILHVGDMVQHSGQDSDWQTFLFDPLRRTELESSIPFILTQGNHDISNGQIGPYFPLISQLSDKPKGYYYALTMGSARIIVLDSNVEIDDQIKWLERELSSKKSQDATFRIVSVHVPPFIEFWDPKTWESGEDRWPLYVRNKVVPLLEKYKVNLVLSGHQHNYQRGSYNGIAYVITGGAGGALDTQRVEDFDFYQKTIIDHHYTVLTLQGNSIHVQMKLLNGTIGDSFTITSSK